MTAATLRVRPPRPARWALLGVPLAFVGVYFAWPVGALLWRAAFGAELGDASATLTAARLLDVTGTTLGLAAAGTALALALGLPAAWATFRLEWPGARLARALLSVPFALPTVVVAAAFSAALRPSGPLGFLGADQSWGAIAVALAFFNVAVVLRVVGGAWAGLDRGAVDAARTLGASRLQALRHVTLPALTPSIAAAAAIVYLFCATSFGLVLVLGGTRVTTVETEIWQQVNLFLDLRAAAVLAGVQVVIVAATLALAGWARSRRERSLPARRAWGSRRARPGNRWLLVAALAPAAALFAVPVAALAARALSGPSGWTLAYVGNLVSAEPPPALSVPLWQAAVNSLEAAAIATAVSLALGVALAWTLTHSRHPAWLDGAIMLPLGVSAVIVGLGALLTLAGGGLGGPRWLIPAAQAVVALPLVVRTLTPTLRAIDPRLRAAAASLGAGPWAVWREVDWPAVRRPVGLAAGLAAAVSLGEFGATAFLARPDHPTLPTAIFRLLSRPGAENVGTAFAAALLLAAVTGTIMALAERWRTAEVADL